MIFLQKLNVTKEILFLLRDVLFGLPHLEARKAKNQGEYESEECGFTERDFSYPDTDFYHFINGDRIILNYIITKIDIIIYVILRFIEDCLREQILYMNPYKI